jgi:hypothetical protein
MKSIVMILSCLVLVTSCKKNVDELPDATQSGANSFGLKLNGELWVPQKAVISGAPILEARYSGTGGVFINARNFASSPSETEFEIYLKNVSGPATIPLNQLTLKYPNQGASYGYYIKRKFMPENEWITSDQFTGSVVVTRFDTVNNIISGTFDFTAGSIDNTADPITITEGRFDIKIH